MAISTNQNLYLPTRISGEFQRISLPSKIEMNEERKNNCSWSVLKAPRPWLQKQQLQSDWLLGFCILYTQPPACLMKNWIVILTEQRAPSAVHSPQVHSKKKNSKMLNHIVAIQKTSLLHSVGRCFVVGGWTYWVNTKLKLAVHGAIGRCWGQGDYNSLILTS